MKKTILFSIVLSLLVQSTSFACTDFLVKAKDGSAVVARSMEFALDTKSNIRFFPKGDRIQSVIPKGPKGISWLSKYDYLGIDAFEKENIVDGLNEKGLSVGGLFFTGSEYQKAEPGKSLALTDLAKWLLGNFETVDEVKRAIKAINVVGVYLPALKQVPGVHLAVHDANRNSIVIEFIKGEQKIYDNPVGVMTNQPTFDWQLTNLRNYISLDNQDNKPKILGEFEIESTGSGNGWFGLPGDWTPPSRFVRTALFVHKAPQPKNATEALNLANHISYTVDIPNGLIETHLMPGILLPELTQWVVLKDLNNKILYYRSYNDGTLKMVDMKKLKLSGSAEKSISMDDENATVTDKTAELQK
jgi:choloylglycine hydrolase